MTQMQKYTTPYPLMTEIKMNKRLGLEKKKGKNSCEFQVSSLHKGQIKDYFNDNRGYMLNQHTQ